MRALILPFCLAAFFIPALPAQSASFDCSAAQTQFEQAVCETPDLSRADETLAKAYATALGGLSDEARASMQADQRDWLSYAERSCIALPSPQSPVTTPDCLLGAYRDRIEVLETSRMIGGHRFYLQSDYSAEIDPDAEPISYWRIASHVFSMPLIDGSELSGSFNDVMMAHRAQSWAGSDESASSSEDVDVSITVETVTANRITLSDNLFWYGHGAAHGNYLGTYIHYLIDEKREMRASDLFAGEGWEQRLVKLTAQALRDQHGDALWDDFEQDIAEIAVDPARWNFGDYALSVQFNPYEVSAYAYGAPKAEIAWTMLEPMLAEGADDIRW
ncbi:hypothetical protein GCM10007989_24830 [Devosia pacifica]|uniref:Lysozyme inhibitor LprI N-terminal domain-containing protein n=1 Tax=Devosia pacifica TaxID=1335967 RepID=A0A918VVV7_9HYPH|nr:DUF3298 domain-containing protein [Devosia pacifica]GHA27926.1 hypothetical protein GCM10007989_24830 [Devosia pacifica]